MSSAQTSSNEDDDAGVIKDTGPVGGNTDGGSNLGADIPPDSAPVGANGAGSQETPAERVAYRAGVIVFGAAGTAVAALLCLIVGKLFIYLFHLVWTL